MLTKRHNNNMKLRRPQTFNIKNTHEKLWIEELHKTISGNLSFGTGFNTEDKNIQGKMIEVPDSGVANTSITIIHNLGYIPKFYDVKYLSLASQIFDFGTPWTTTKIFLASTTAHTKFRVFIH